MCNQEWPTPAMGYHPRRENEEYNGNGQTEQSPAIFQPEQPQPPPAQAIAATSSPVALATPKSRVYNSLMSWSIISMLFCCLPFGLVAMIYANRANTLTTSGQYMEAAKAASTAKILNILAILCGLFCSPLSILSCMEEM